MEKAIALPMPNLKGAVSLEEAILRRRSTREFSNRSLTRSQLSQLLWACQGIREEYYRTIPSAGATYPLEIFLVVGEGGVESLDGVVYRYVAKEHSIIHHLPGDLRRRLCSACLEQGFIRRAPLSFVVCAEYSRTTGRYGDRGVRYVHMEVGHLGQNLALQGEALGLRSLMVGAFHDEDVSQVLNLPLELKPLYVVPVGYSRE
ncbi:MAG: SagB/ThcOx family dehydrogenase [Syntrophobacterales bacterium]|nr:MAG: SagB/ThcOx family dehydrogenase [Syntrophobacterales bacterium]